jgi:hypothetical protein
MIEQRTGTDDRRKEPSHSVELELASFTQNIAAFEAILGKMEAEVSAPVPNVDRLIIYQSEIQSMLAEIQSQQARAVALRGPEDGNVQRFQAILSNRLGKVISKADDHMRSSQSKLDDLNSHIEALDPAAAELSDLLASQSENDDRKRDQAEELALAAKRLGQFMSSHPGTKVSLDPILDKLLTLSLHALVDRRLRNAVEQPHLPVDSPPSAEQDTPMTDLTRQEVDAKLAQNKAEVDARLANFDTSVKTGFADLRAEFAEMRAEMAKQSGDMRTEMANVRAETHKGTIDVIKWVVGFGIAILGTVFTLSKTADKPAPAPMVQPAAIVITVPGATVAPAQAPAPAK